jgi:hypothetical protein
LQQLGLLQQIPRVDVRFLAAWVLLIRPTKEAVTNK